MNIHAILFSSFYDKLQQRSQLTFWCPVNSSCIDEFPPYSPLLCPLPLLPSQKDVLFKSRYPKGTKQPPKKSLPVYSYDEITPTYELNNIFGYTILPIVEKTMSVAQ